MINTLEEALDKFNKGLQYMNECNIFGGQYEFTAVKEKPEKAYIIIPCGTLLKTEIETTETDTTESTYVTETEYYINIPKNVGIMLSLNGKCANVIVSQSPGYPNLECGLSYIKINDVIYNCINNCVLLSSDLCFCAREGTNLYMDANNKPIFTVPEDWS
ncbi:MAG: hypothetical protein H0U27_01280 [Nitrosopumilus sp.]|nr:hypothetical protein [Nitrosopumilus sp.]